MGTLELKCIFEIHYFKFNITIYVFLFLLGRRIIWRIGSSIAYWAHRNASTRPGGPNLNLQYIGGSVNWYGKRSTMWEELSPVVEKQLRRPPPPNFLAIQLGSNDLG
jgi:hypothetical protein